MSLIQYEISTLVVKSLLQEDIGDAVVVMVVAVGGVLIGAGESIVSVSAVNIGTVVGLVKKNPGVLEAGDFPIAIANF